MSECVGVSPRNETGGDMPINFIYLDMRACIYLLYIYSAVGGGREAREYKFPSSLLKTPLKRRRKQPARKAFRARIGAGAQIKLSLYNFNR